METKPNHLFLSVIVITYNQEEYITECLKSIVNQKTNFDFEVILANDNSPDNSHKVIETFLSTEPKSVIKYFKHDKNKGMINNFFWALRQAKGKYIAICEGDDFWTDDNKLQEQVDFLEQNPSFSFAFHDVDVIQNPNENFEYIASQPNKTVLKFNDILFKNYIQTCTVVFRSSFMETLPVWINEFAVGDIPLTLYLSDKGPAKYIPKKMGVYRRHSKNVSANRQSLKKSRSEYIKMYTKMRKYFGYNRTFILSLLIIRTKLGKIKDILGLNPTLR